MSQSYKTVEFFADLYPGWQDAQHPYVWLRQAADIGNAELPQGSRRVRVLVDLPQFGGSRDASETVRAEVKEV